MADTPNIMEVGIDLGTTNTLAAYTDAAGNIRYLTFDRGSRENPHFLPSVIAWDNGQIIVGQPALDLLPFRPTDVFTAFKEHMGTQDVCTAGTQQMLARDAAAHILREVHRQLERSFPDVSQFLSLIHI